MIVKETYLSPNSSDPLIKVYSNKNFFIEYNGQIYESAIVANEEEANKYIETSTAIPARIADEYFVYNTFIGEYQNITQKQILEAKDILIKALQTLTDEEAYRVKFLFKKWKYTENYHEGERVFYNGELYNVIQTPSTNANPEINTECYQKANRPADLIEEWDDVNRKVYNIGDKVRIGDYIYESVIDNNTWAPREFPVAWKIITEVK